MANQYEFDDNDLLLSGDKMQQFTMALTTPEVADPLQELCDEGAGIVARMTTGYVIDTDSIFSFIRAIAVHNAYINSGTPAPEDVTARYNSNMAELTAIAGGKRPNLPKAVVTTQAGISGAVGSERRIRGRINYRDAGTG